MDGGLIQTQFSTGSSDGPALGAEEQHPGPEISRKAGKAMLHPGGDKEHVASLEPYRLIAAFEDALAGLDDVKLVALVLDLRVLVLRHEKQQVGVAALEQRDRRLPGRREFSCRGDEIDFERKFGHCDVPALAALANRVKR